ncbi:proline-rich protein PRCC isoform X1 [Takifugu rubripes]|uniref:Proline rich mitotic checkpoint control factor n=2 Tax=Takifugu rubripes TaxID=31033 RepID=H2UBZ0_TAKRU|nr:proline-rich protein PRCC isoform X1 [Takifugu rubripes]
MSLVAYGSSDDSDAEETQTSVREKRTTTGGLLSSMPAAKFPGPTGGISRGPGKGLRAKEMASKEDTDPAQYKGGLFSSLPKPKKRTEPVKITVPEIEKRDSDSDDEEPTKKRTPTQHAGSGLSSLLPQPKNLTLKEVDRPLIPHTLTKRQDPKGTKPGTPSQCLVGSSPSPSAIKAAAKSAAMQLARQIADQDNEEEMTPQNYFSLGESSQPLIPAVPSLDTEPRAPAEVQPFLPSDEPGQSDAPLDFGGNNEEVGAWGGQYPQYLQPSAAPEDFQAEYYNDPYYQDPNSGVAEAEEPGQSAMFDDEGFMRLQGKRNRGKEEVKFLEIKGDDQLSGTQQWLTKNMTEEKQNRQSYSKRKGHMPTGQQRRKHQITYLIHQAKERELELKNTWAENRLTRRQTQAKYGF